MRAASMRADHGRGNSSALFGQNSTNVSCGSAVKGSRDDPISFAVEMMLGQPLFKSWFELHVLPLLITCSQAMLAAPLPLPIPAGAPALVAVVIAAVAAPP